jgi:hypothetical protein
MTSFSRRHLVVGTGALCASVSARGLSALAEDEDRLDLSRPLQDWQTVSGDWSIQEVPGASQGRALVQRAESNEFNVIVAPGGLYDNIRVSVRFKPISGREDASGGIVFRFSEGRYYLIRANALEDNFRLYYYDNGRHMIASASTKAPALGQWHQLQIAVNRDRIQGWLNDQALIDHRDTRFAVGRIGLWTKADSVTAFENLVVVPLEG